MLLITHLLTMISVLVSDRTRLAAENVALRQQITVLKRSVKRARIEDSDRIFWILMKRILKDWKECLLIVKPETVIRWHRKGFAYYWNRKSRAERHGRPPIEVEVIELIRTMSRDNGTWGSPRIQSELALLGHKVAKSTVERYMVRRPKEPSQTWKTFLPNHMGMSAACDFFVVPSITFKMLFCFVVMSHDRRRILHVNVTKHPTAEWTAQQLVEAFPGDQSMPRFLFRDRDGIYGSVFRRRARLLGLKEVVSAPKSPWQNPFVERLVGSIRRECTDHVVALGARHLLRVLREYQTYHNGVRPHLSLDGNAPTPRDVESGDGDIVAMPVLGGLHHRYSRAA